MLDKPLTPPRPSSRKAPRKRGRRAFRSFASPREPLRAVRIFAVKTIRAATSRNRPANGLSRKASHPRKTGLDALLKMAYSPASPVKKTTRWLNRRRQQTKETLSIHVDGSARGRPWACLRTTKRVPSAWMLDGTLRFFGDHRLRTYLTGCVRFVRGPIKTATNRSRKKSVLCPPGTRPFPGAFFCAQSAKKVRRTKEGVQRGDSSPPSYVSLCTSSF
jgi:hypothetical protein